MADRELASLTLPDGRLLWFDDTGAPVADAPVVLWHHGSPHTGELYEPFLRLARERGIRMLSLARPGYGPASPVPGRSVADAARDALAVADAHGIERFIAMGASGGGPHALASAALAPDRVAAVAVEASPAPFVDEPAWWRGMADDGGLRAAVRGRAARIRHEEDAEFDAESFVDTDWAALEGEWAGVGADAGAAAERMTTGLPDDDVAFVHPWGVDLADVRAPVVLIQGRRDRVIPPAHAELLAAALPDATIWWREDAGHIAALAALPDALDWALERSRP